jgi:hypothetical protein
MNTPGQNTINRLRSERLKEVRGPVFTGTSFTCRRRSSEYKSLYTGGTKKKPKQIATLLSGAMPSKRPKKESKALGGTKAICTKRCNSRNAR